MDIGLNYNLDLVEDVNDILTNDFWVFCNFSASMIPKIEDPLKFTSTVSIFVKEGECKIELDLMPYHIKAPCIFNIKQGQILQCEYFSDDFNSSFIVLSKRFCDNLLILLKNSPIYGSVSMNQLVSVPTNLLERFNRFYEHMKEIFADSKDSSSYQAMTLAIASFFYECGTKCYLPALDKIPKGASRLAERFIVMVQQNFKKERFLDFYANRLEVSAKHLSRTIKEATGFSAVEWIDRFVILEAKVLLKATNLTIQQIADELNFNSQSFFGKYFKKHTGTSPKAFRNS
ncbi:MAG: AraC family transcriptional regulator [Muribaculaceae bacterium]|nr:AraC family transcriptional regulator [Muribaculaceae bacterium]